MVSPSELMALAGDPMLIKGIYEICDQWCMYCDATSHCLAYRCCPGTTQMREPHESNDEDERLVESLIAAKRLADAEGRLAPPEIETMLSGDRERQQRMFRLDDPLERLGRQYMMTSAAYLSTRANGQHHASSSAAGPTPLEVVSWFHALVPARIFRAVLGAIEAREGVRGRHQDTLAAAKFALVGIDRSLDALRILAAEDDDPRIDLLASQLRRLGPAVERRFPAARGFLRPGLDTPVGVRSSSSLFRRLRAIRLRRNTK
jgi:hypothetical protein